MSDMKHKLRSLGLFQSLSERELTEVSKHFKIIYAKNRSLLFQENVPIDNLFIILYGSVKIQKNDISGAPVILNFLGRGEFLGIAMVDVLSPKYPATAITIEDSALLCFTRKFFKETLIHIPAIKETVTEQVSKRFLEFQNDRCMERSHIAQKLADLLLRLWERQTKNSDRQILFPMTRKDISLRIGTHTETVIRILSKWTKSGIIRTTNRHIEIVDLVKLQEIRSETQTSLITKDWSEVCEVTMS